MRPTNISSCLILLVLPLVICAQPGMYSGHTGRVAFKSDALLEVITAASDKLSGAINPSTNALAFSVLIQSFQGFNNTVQRDHFLENYMEAGKYPVATFSGKIIEIVDFSVPGTYDIRVKGMLNIHGISMERILPGVLVVLEDTIDLRTVFTITLQDHDIAVPKLLSQKIAEKITVQVAMNLKLSE